MAEPSAARLWKNTGSRGSRIKCVRVSLDYGRGDFS